MKDTVKNNTNDMYLTKILNRKTGGKGENLYKLREFFGVENELDNVGFTDEGQLHIGSISYNLYYHIVNILSTKFRIEGLPKHLKVKNFWKYFVSGNMVFIKSKIKGVDGEQLLFAQGIPNDYDLYYDPKSVTPIFPNESGNIELDETDNFVEVLFNPQRKSLLLTIGKLLSDLQWYYDEMLFDTQATRPSIYINGLSADDDLASELNKQVGERNLFKQLIQQGSNEEDGNRLFNKLTEELNGKIEVVQGKPRINDVLIPSIDIITNYIFEFLGINRNDNKDKKERMIVDEVNINNETKRFATTTLLDLMEKGFNEVNERFGSNIKVIDTEEEMEKQEQEHKEKVSQNKGDDE